MTRDLCPTFTYISARLNVAHIFNGTYQKTMFPENSKMYKCLTYLTRQTFMTFSSFFSSCWIYRNRPDPLPTSDALSLFFQSHNIFILTELSYNNSLVFIIRFRVCASVILAAAPYPRPTMALSPDHFETV